MPPARLFGRVALACLALGALGSTACVRAPLDRVLEVEIDSPAPSEARLLVFETAWGAPRTLRQPVPAGRARLRFALPSATTPALHFSPLSGPGEVLIAAMRVVGPTGEEVARLPPGSLLPVEGVQSMLRDGDAVRIIATSGAPLLVITVPCTEGSSAGGGTGWVTPFSLGFVGMLVAGLCGLAIGLVLWDALGACTPRDIAATGAVLVGLFLVVVGARAWLVSRYGSPIPFLDQWWAEAHGLYVPMHDRCLAWRQLFAPHNEHRIFFTRLVNLLLLSVNRQWDGLLQMVVNAGLIGGVAVVLAAVMWVANRRRDLDVIALVVAVVFGFPWGWENALTGFGSQFYFLALFAVSAVWLMTAHRPPSLAWVTGLLLGVCSLVSVAAGVLTSLAIGVAAVTGLVFAPGRRRDVLAALAGAAAIGALGWWLMVPPLEYHATLKAGDAGEFVQAFARNLAWPAVGVPLLAPLMWMPMAWLLAACVRRPATAGTGDRVLLGLGAWVCVNAALLAYARGANGQAPPYRYHEMLGIGAVLNAVALATGLRRARETGVRWVDRAIAAGWCLAFALGAASLSSRGVLEGARVHDGWHREWEPSVRNFVLTDDLPTFLSKTPLEEIPYNDAAMLANGWLRHPYVRSILPAAVREPIGVVMAANPQNAFVERGYPRDVQHDPVRPGIGSFPSAGAGALGAFESAPMACQLGGSLKFQIAGFPGGPGLTLALHDAQTGEDRPIWGAAGKEWGAFNVWCPEHAFTVRASDASTDPHGWLAFRAPVELGWLSRWAERVLTRSLEIVFVGLLLALLGLRARWIVRAS